MGNALLVYAAHPCSMSAPSSMVGVEERCGIMAVAVDVRAAHRPALGPGRGTLTYEWVGPRSDLALGISTS